MFDDLTVKLINQAINRGVHIFLFIGCEQLSSGYVYITFCFLASFLYA